MATFRTAQTSVGRLCYSSTLSPVSSSTPARSLTKNPRNLPSKHEKDRLCNIVWQVENWAVRQVGELAEVVVNE